MKKYLYAGLVSIVALSVAIVATPPKTASAHGFVPHFLSINYASVTSNSATLYATVDSMHSSDGGHAWFEYGTNPQSSSYEQSWGNKVGVRSLPRQGWTFMITKITGLKPNTTYYFHVKAENRNGSNTGETVSFRTLGSNHLDMNMNSNWGMSHSSVSDTAATSNVYNTTTNNTNITTTTNNNNNWYYTNNTTNNSSNTSDYNYNTSYTDNSTQTDQYQSNYIMNDSNNNYSTASYIYHY